MQRNRETIPITEFADDWVFRPINNQPFLYFPRPTLFPLRQSKYDPWHRLHNFTLPAKDDCNYVPRMLYKKHIDVGRGGSLVDSSLFVRRVVGSNPALSAT